MATIITLNNGDTAIRQHGESYERMLVRILKEARDKIGHIPTYKEAKKCPYMPKNMGLYEKRCISYEYAVHELERLDAWNAGWQKPTDSQRAEIELKTELKNKRTRISEIFTQTPYVAPKTKEVEEMTTDKRNDDEQKVELHEAMRSFAEEHLRWPKDQEINAMRDKGLPGWQYSAATINRKYGSRKTWANQFFPEGGLPKGFKTGRTRRSATTSKPKEPRQPIASNNPQEAFMELVKKCTETIGNVKDVQKLSLTMTIKGVEKSFEFNLSV